MGVSFTATITVICTHQIVFLAKITIFLFKFWQYCTAVAANNPFSHFHGFLTRFPVVLGYPYVQCFLCLSVFYDNRCSTLSFYGNFPFTAYLQDTLVRAFVACLCCYVLSVLFYGKLHRFLCVEL